MKKEHVKPVVWIASIAVVLLVVFGITLINQKTYRIQEMETANAGLEETIHQRDSVVNDLMNTFNEIDENLTFINARRSQLTLEASREMNPGRKARLLTDIRLMDSMLVASSKHIEDLEARLKDSGIRMRSFENRIAALNKTISENSLEMAELTRSIEQKEMLIADLNSQVEMYQVVLEEKNEEIFNKELNIMERQQKLNTAFYTMGSFRELKEQGILSRTGGILGLGSSKAIQPNLSNDHFTMLDITQTTTIPIASKSARIISEHPADSYEFIEEEGIISALIIEDPEEFWRISKYAVIETK